MNSTHTHYTKECKSWIYCEERVKDRIKHSKYVKEARESLMKKKIIP